MMIMAIDTAGADCAVGIYDASADRMMSSVTETIGKGHAELLMRVIDRALDAADLTLERIERIAVTIGPGSFTGVRVGVSAARGFALALGVDAVGVSTLDVLANAWLADHPPQTVFAAMDAKRDEVYIQCFDPSGRGIDVPRAMSVGAARDMCRAAGAVVTGSASLLLGAAGDPVRPDMFPIGIVAKLAARMPQASGKPKPLYLRAPDAKPQTGFALSRM